MSGANIIRDDIDFSLYMQATDAGHKIIPAGAYAEEVADYLLNGEQLCGAKLPWRKTRDLIRLDGKTAVYVCEDFVCQRPVTAVGELDVLLTRG